MLLANGSGGCREAGTMRRRRVHAEAVKLTFYVFLWSRPGMEQALIAYEDAVLEPPRSALNQLRCP